MISKDNTDIMEKEQEQEKSLWPSYLFPDITEDNHESESLYFEYELSLHTQHFTQNCGVTEISYFDEIERELRQ